MFFREVWAVFKQATIDWVEDRASQLGAALAFYSILSLSPLLVISIAIAGFVFGEQAARGEIVAQIEHMVGQQGAEAIQTLLANAHRPEEGLWATILGTALLLFGASGVFGQLREALNTIWEIEPADQRGVWPFIRQRLLPFLLVLASGCLLLGLLLLSTALAAAARYLEGWWPVAESVWYAVDSAASFFIVFLLFALIFKVLPAARVAWRDVWLGAATSAALFLVGKMLVGIYLAHSSIASSYGAAGSLVVLLVWIYYAAQIFFFGAELTQVFAERYGSRKIGRIRTARRGAAIGPAASK